jgi:quinolinate synthase|tara:strand:+ start:346 stop:1272 length:927 start_codon:yes stop_codon:yes gene_type:complete
MQIQQKKEIDTQNLIQYVLELKRKNNAVILVHNYQNPEMYKIADYIGDSLGLSQQAANSDADLILFCGVKFMAETAKILSPDKTVLLPTMDAGCALADMATPRQLKQVKKMHPDAAVVSYVNTTAEIKAMSDICCTSMNAEKIVNSLAHEEIIFLPDENLGRYIASKSEKRIILWDGFCFVHDKLNVQDLAEIKEKYPAAKIIAHPECKKDILEMADHICGTGGMKKFANSSGNNDFIVVTECGMTEKLRIDVPNKNFYSFCNICPYMKSITMPLVVDSLIKRKYKITLPQNIIVKARRALDRMLEFN